MSRCQGLYSLLDYPVLVCTTTMFPMTYVHIFDTGNASNVGRIWALMPTFYTVYWALLPIWPHGNSGWGYISPYVPEQAAHFTRDFSPRALVMLGLTVCSYLPLTPDLCSLTDIWTRLCGCSDYTITPGDVGYSTRMFFLLLPPSSSFTRC